MSPERASVRTTADGPSFAPSGGHSARLRNVRQMIWSEISASGWHRSAAGIAFGGGRHVADVEMAQHVSPHWVNFMVEHVLFQDGDVVVTTSRVRVGGTTYALRNITSVRVARTDSAWGARVAMTLVLFLAWIIVNWLGAFALGFGSAMSLLITYAAFAYGVWWVWNRMRVSITYHCSLATSGEEVQALSSKDQAFIEGVVNAINEAIIRAGS